MSRPPLVSIIIVSYNNRAFIEECLRCATSQDHPSIEVVVVDQNSIDGTQDIIRERFPQVTLIQNDRNTGFAAGMNRGVQASAGEHVLLLNSDLFMDPAFVSQAVVELSDALDDRRGMLASITYRYRSNERTREIDSRGARLLPYHATVDVEDADTRQWVLGPAGCAMFLSRAMLDDVRLPDGDFLDSTYFCYGEDCELALRAQVLGWRCLYAPIVAGWHIGAASVNQQPRYSDKPVELRHHALKNRHLTVLTCYPIGLLVWTLPWNLLTEVGQITVYACSGRWESLRCLFGAYFSVLRMLPQVWARRRWIQRRRRVSSAYLRSLYVDWTMMRVMKSLIQKA